MMEVKGKKGKRTVKAQQKLLQTERNIEATLKQNVCLQSLEKLSACPSGHKELVTLTVKTKNGKSPRWVGQGQKHEPLRYLGVLDISHSLLS